MFQCYTCRYKFIANVKKCPKCHSSEIADAYLVKAWFDRGHLSDNEQRDVDKLSDFDQNNPVDCTMEQWQDIYSNPDYDMDNDHSMDY